MVTERGKRKVRVLITAGPTWVALDAVRVISNTASGETGISLAVALKSSGAKVTLLLGPGAEQKVAGVKVVRYRYYDDLRAALQRALAAEDFDFIIHSAAVSDFAPDKVCRSKMASGRKYALLLKPLPKLLSGLVGRGAAVVMFKFEPGLRGRPLINKGCSAMRESGSEYVVANTCCPYEAYLIGREGLRATCRSKASLVSALKELILG